jgi:hypothetical protein
MNRKKHRLAICAAGSRGYENGGKENFAGPERDISKTQTPIGPVSTKKTKT